MKNGNEIQNRTAEEAMEADIQYTPPHLAKSLIDITTIQGSTILDPCSGTGAFLYNFPADMEWFSCEINRGHDFFKFDKEVDWIISNPPFSQLSKWLEHTALIAQVGFAYIMPTYSLTPNRLRMIESFGFYCEKAVIIENPKEWQIGFTMAYYVFKKWGQRNIRLVDRKEPIQERLF